MTTEKDIDRAIQNDVDRFNHAIYDGTLPDTLFDMFKRCLMILPLTSHRLNPSYIKDMVAKRQNELNFIEVGVVINLIKDVSPREVYPSLEEFLDTSIIFEAVSTEYNKKISDFEKTCIKKKNFQMKIAGLDKSTISIAKAADGKILQA